MDLLTGGLIVGGIVLAAKALGGGSKTPAKTTTTAPDCGTPKDCAALVACATPILAKATAADVAVLTKMGSQALTLGCAGLAKQISDALSKLGKSTDTTGGGTTKNYEIVQGIGLVVQEGATPGDMLIIGLKNADGSQKYITPVVYSEKNEGDLTGVATFEKALADIALDKAKKNGLINPALLGAGSINAGAPPDLADGATFAIRFANLIGVPGNVLAVVTAAQMKSSSLVTTSPEKFSTAGEGDGYLPIDADNIGGPFGGQGSGVIGSAFGSRSRFGGTTRIGG